MSGRARRASSQRGTSAAAAGAAASAAGASESVRDGLRKLGVLLKPKTLDADGWNEVAEGDGTDQAETSWLDRKWPLKGVPGAEERAQGAGGGWSINDLRALPKTMPDTLYLTLNAQLRVRRSREGADRKRPTKKRAYIAGGNANSNKRQHQPSRQDGYIPPAAAASLDLTPTAPSGPAPGARNGRLGSRTSIAAAGTKAFNQATKRDANGLADHILGIPQARVAAALTKALKRKEVQEHCKDCDLTITEAQSAMYRTLAEGQAAIHEALKFKGDETRKRKLSDVEQQTRWGWGPEMERRAQLQAAANIAEAGKQTLRAAGHKPAGINALRKLGIGRGRQKTTAKELAGVFLDATKELSLNLFKRRCGKGTHPEDVAMVVEWVTVNYLLEIPGRVTKVKRRNPSVSIGDPGAWEKVAMPTCALRDTKDNIFAEFKNRHADLVKETDATNPAAKMKRGIKW